MSDICFAKCDECGGDAFKIIRDAALNRHCFCKKHWDEHVMLPHMMYSVSYPVEKGDQNDRSKPVDY